MIRYKNKLFFLVSVVLSNFVVIGSSSTQIQLEKDSAQAITADNNREQFLDEQVMQNPYLDQGFYLLRNRNLLNIDIPSSSKSPLYNYFDKHISHDIDDDAQSHEVNFGDVHGQALDLVVGGLKTPFLTDFEQYIKDPALVTDTSVIEYVMDQNNRVIVQVVRKDFINTPIGEKFNTNFIFIHGRLQDSLLHIAAQAGNLEIAEQLLSLGVDVDLLGRHNNTALKIAVSRDDIPMVKKLLSYQAHISPGRNSFVNALTELKSAAMVQVFVDDDASKNADNQIGTKRKRVKKNKDFENALNYTCNYLFSPLYTAIKNQNVEVVETLLKTNKTKLVAFLDPNRAAWWSSKNNIKMVAILLKHGFDKNLKNAAKETLFFQACKDSNIPMIRLLQSVGCQYVDQAKNQSGKPSRWPLDYAIDNCNEKIVRELMMYNKNYGVPFDYLIDCLGKAYASKIDQDVVNKISYKILDQFVRVEDMQKVEKILAIDEINWDSLVHMAASENNIEVVKRLIEEKKLLLMSLILTIALFYIMQLLRIIDI
ncbi:ankyrin repeat domain-containing protein [Candidatus Chromulinivorax destructor]|uniref:Uncharacterized protein n=1 Tax=Candidatus Chromulinivorax destructor TaxID=2066483 RepID=A0A345ZCX5_9BACT|nr:ankyrin repeat domain-containing protein [Candidatus Chromulinivorax destructor]AXK61142.1 hypothetical protein C0J27_05425 [Candidatus Chromulinivorax destructor]